MTTELAQQQAEVLPAVLAPATANIAQSREDQLAALESEAKFLEVAYGLADKACSTALVAAHFRNKPADGAIAVAFGASLGWHWTKALQDVYVVNGKPCIQSKEMRELMIRAGHSIWEEEVGPTRVVLAGTRRGSDIVVRVEWTIEKAEQAGLVSSNPNYKKYPENMLYARCTTDLSKRLAPDALSGLGIVEEQRDIAPQAPRRVPSSASTVAAELRKSLAAKPPADEPDAPKADQAPPAETADDAAPPTTATNRRMHALFRDAGLDNNRRAERLTVVSKIISRPIGTGNEMTEGEAVHVINTLQELKDTDVLRDSIEGLLAEAAATDQNKES